VTTLGGLVPGACPCETTDFFGHAHTTSAYRVLIWVCHESSLSGKVPEHICNNIIYNLAISLA